MAALRDRIEFVRTLVSYGEDRLGLRFEGSFSRYNPRRPLAHWLYAVYPDRLESALPNNDPFRFSWDLARARRWEREHRRRGHHTYLYSAEAHGGIACPILPGLLRASPARQAYVVFHEAWHVTLRMEQIRVPYPLEEATGRVVGVMGAVHFAEQTGNAGLLAETRLQARDWGRLSNLVNRSVTRFGRAAAGGKSGCARELRQCARDAEALRRRIASPWESEELTREINTAFLFRYAAYTRLYPLALQVFRHAGKLERAMSLYKQAGRAGAIAALRRHAID